MNWVEKRHRSAKMLQDHATDVWNDVRSAIQDACASFNELYPESGEVTCLLENGRRIRITHKSALKKKLTVLISFESNGIVVTPEGDAPTRYSIGADETQAFPVHEGFQITPDEFSRSLLERWLFPQ